MDKDSQMLMKALSSVKCVIVTSYTRLDASLYSLGVEGLIVAS